MYVSLSRLSPLLLIRCCVGSCAVIGSLMVEGEKTSLRREKVERNQRARSKGRGYDERARERQTVNETEKREKTYFGSID